MSKKILLFLPILVLFLIIFVYLFGYFGVLNASYNPRLFPKYSNYFFKHPMDVARSVSADVFGISKKRLAESTDKYNDFVTKNKESYKSDKSTVVMLPVATSDSKEKYNSSSNNLLKQVTGNTIYSQDDWTYTDFPVFTTVEDSIFDKLGVGLFINVPKNQPFSNVKKYVTVDCPKDKTTLLDSMTRNVLKDSVDLSTELQNGDSLITYCLDKNCNQLGRECVIDRVSAFSANP